MEGEGGGVDIRDILAEEERLVGTGGQVENNNQYVQSNQNFNIR